MLLEEKNIDYILLQSGAPLYLKNDNFEISLNQPKIIEYAYCGGITKLMTFVALLNIEPSIENLKDFPGIKELDILCLTIEKDKVMQNIFYDFLSLFFVNFEFGMREKDDHMVLVLTNTDNKEISFELSNIDFLLIKYYIKEILYIREGKGEDEKYNTVSSKANEIAKKLKRGRDRLKKNKKPALFNAISAFAINEHTSVEDVYKKYTLYQFYTQYERMGLKSNFDHSYRAMLAGAKDIKLPEWQG